MTSCDLTTTGTIGDWNIHRCSKCGREIKSHATAEKTLRNCTSYGLGDLVAAGLEVTGIAPAVRWLRGGKCGGCKQRQAWLNSLTEGTKK